MLIYRRSIATSAKIYGKSSTQFYSFNDLLARKRFLINNDQLHATPRSRFRKSSIKCCQWLSQPQR
ncbi:hypothetical protein F7734_40525 [Scytonema sp. UIC 10036]|uniref:hypothetical protein n=1 Tax=Scytonema sp. UIC 10036 TaxID=2304196 RepID=UPI0012DA52D1|nr:hypothetical protein [Scytonema sp. UIC 10036]MUG98262.1 hypothetical protein [Scytonema sp. UIC 10036]